MNTYVGKVFGKEYYCFKARFQVIFFQHILSEESVKNKQKHSYIPKLILFRSFLPLLRCNYYYLLTLRKTISWITYNHFVALVMHYIIIQIINTVKRSSSWRLASWEKLKSIKNIAFMSKDRPNYENLTCFMLIIYVFQFCDDSMY